MISLNMISLSIKLMNGDLLDIQFNHNLTPHDLYQDVWNSLPDNIKTDDLKIYQMMLIRTGDKEDEGWIRPVHIPTRVPQKYMSPLEDGEVLIVFFDTTHYNYNVKEIVDEKDQNCFLITIYRIRESK